MRAIIVTQKRFDELNKEAHEYCQKNISGYNADRWCDKKVHPTNGKISFTIKDKVLPILKDEKVLKLTKDWFPIEEL